MKALGIYGCGGSGKETKELTDRLSCWNEVLFIDDGYPSGNFYGIRRLTFEDFTAEFTPESAEIIIAVGEPRTRKLLYEKVKSFGYSLPVLIHPQAMVSPTATLDEGVIVKHFATVSCEAHIAKNTCLETGAVVGHDACVGNHCQISTNVVIAGGCSIGSGTFIGLNVPIRQGLSIGSNTIVSMGSVVQRDLPDNVIAMGNPARPMKNKDDSKVFGK